MEEDFEEEEVWATMWEGGDDDSPNTRKQKDASFSSSTKPSSAPRKIPGSNMAAGEEGNSTAALSRQSAPVAIPNCNWSNILEKGEIGGDEEEEEDADDRVPPHVWITKKMERSQISSFSVCEGAGRTLKGRDQRKVRDAVLTRTGFLE